MDVVRSHCLVMAWRVKLGEEVTEIDMGRSPINMKLFLFHPVPDPVKSHVDGAGLALLDCVVSQSHGR